MAIPPRAPPCVAWIRGVPTPDKGPRPALLLRGYGLAVLAIIGTSHGSRRTDPFLVIDPVSNPLHRRWARNMGLQLDKPTYFDEATVAYPRGRFIEVDGRTWRVPSDVLAAIYSALEDRASAVARIVRPAPAVQVFGPGLVHDAERLLVEFAGEMRNEDQRSSPGYPSGEASTTDDVSITSLSEISAGGVGSALRSAILAAAARAVRPGDKEEGGPGVPHSDDDGRDGPR